MKLLICLILFSMSLAWGQIQTEKKVSQELDVANAEAAKPALLFKAIDESIDQYSTEMGFDAKTFRTKLDQKFTKYFDIFKERKLSEKFGKNYSAELTEEQKKEFLTGLEIHRQSEFMKFSRFNELVDAHSFKDISADPANAKLWTATVGLNINRVRLDRLVQRVMSSQEKQYSRIYLLVEMNLLGMTWNELGLERSSSFTNPVMDSWNQWFQSNLPANVEDITLCEGECVQEFIKWQELPQDEKLQVSQDLMKALWLRVSFNLRKLSHIPSLNEWSLEWDGNAVLLDASTKRVIATDSILPQNKTWRGLDQKALNSALAGQIYRGPLAAFTTFNKKIVDAPELNQVSRLVIQGHQHLGDILSLMELLKKEGRGINLTLQLDLFSQKDAQLLCFYQGEEKSFSDLLSRLNELKSSHSYRLVNEFTGVHHLLKLVAE